MNRKELTDQIRKSHEAGKRVAVSFCSHVPLEMLDSFKEGMERVLGEGKCHVLSIRSEGGIREV